MAPSPARINPKSWRSFTTGLHERTSSVGGRLHATALNVAGAGHTDRGGQRAHARGDLLAVLEGGQELLRR